MAILGWEESGRSHAEIQGLIGPIAEALGAGWAVAEDRHHIAGRMELHGPDGIELEVQVGRTRVAVCGIHAPVGSNPPSVYGCEDPTITFAATKSPQRMAAEITRRLLPAVRRDVQLLADARAAREARLAGRRATLLRARDLLGGNLAWAQEGHRGGEPEFERASTMYSYGQPHLTIELHDYDRHDHVDTVEISGLTHEQVLQLVQAAAPLTGRA